MSTILTENNPQANEEPWRQMVARYRSSDSWRSMWDAANSLIPYFILWYLMYRSLAMSFWLTLALSILAAGFLMRIFIIIFHDCGHGSFFKWRRANHVLGFITGFLTFTPYFEWRHDHAIHHATSGDLDRRGVGDVWTLTVQEYLALPPREQLAYRVFRHPLVMFTLGPLFAFVIHQRVSRRRTHKLNVLSVYWTNLAVLGIAIVMSLAIGVWAYLLLQLLVIEIAGTVGIWFFYIQHQFEGVRWVRHEDWDFLTVAMTSASFYKLPRLLQWFSGNIGYHHVHHLSPRIPGYLLEKCHNENAMFREVTPVTLRDSLKSLRLRLWDEERQRLVGFDDLKTIPH
jgi:acyl-lipid omega-6 desaturase (Delta-12 desaturase)